MRTVTTNRPPAPVILISADCDSEKNRILKEVKEGREVSFNEKIYGHETVREALRSFYHGKCAFCESLETGGYVLNVEHYRPKAKVTGEKGKPGYYWLAYEWSNLLPACSTCNGVKGNKFPLINGLSCRLTFIQDAKILNELQNPLILHPEFDEPHLRLAFKPDGTMEAINPVDTAAIQTIQSLKLNRKLLVRERRRTRYINVINGIIGNIKHLHHCKERFAKKQFSLSDFKKQLVSIFELDFEMLLNSTKETASFSLFFENALNNFEDFILKELVIELEKPELSSIADPHKTQKATFLKEIEKISKEENISIEEYLEKEFLRFIRTAWIEYYKH